MEKQNKIINGYIENVIWYYKNDANDDDDENYKENNDNENEWYNILINIIDTVDENYTRYTIKGFSFMYPEDRDLVQVTIGSGEVIDGKITHNAIGPIKIELPTKIEAIKMRMEKLLKDTKGIGKKIMDDYVVKMGKNIWKSPSDTSISLQKNDCIIRDVINNYILYDKKYGNQSEKEHVLKFFEENFQIFLNIKQTNIIYSKLNFIGTEFPLENKKIKKCLLHLVGYLKIETIMKIVETLKYKRKIEINIINNLYYYKERGNSCTPINNICKENKKKEYENAIKYLTDNKFIVNYKDNIYLKQIYDEERNIAKLIKNHYECSVTKYNDINFDQIYKNQKKIIINEKQQKSIHNAFEYTISVINGFPGVGKTLCAKTIGMIANDNKLKYMILTPTGKVCLKIIKDLKKENIYDDNVFTIHKFIVENNKNFKKQSYKQIHEYDEKFSENSIIIVDESSMISSTLLNDFLSCMDDNNVYPHLVFMGDDEQLPSINYGNVFKSLIESKIVNTKLTQLYRGDNLINQKIEKFRTCTLTQSMEDIFNVDAFNYISINCQEQVEKIIKNVIEKKYNSELEQIRTLCEAENKNFEDEWNKVKKKFFNKMMFITPTHKNINIFTPTIKKIINKMTGENNNCEDINKFNIGDYVMIKKNIYKRTVLSKCKKNNCVELKTNENLYNGMIGKIGKHENGFYTVYINDEDEDENNKNVIKVNEKNIEKYMMLTYINTVHKYQGSEADYVYVIISNEDRFAVNWNMIYTAISRAKKSCTLIAHDDSYNTGFNKKIYRHTKLTNLIDEEINNVTNMENKNGTNIQIKYTKKCIPKPLKLQVWCYYIGREKGIAKCFCCKIRDIEKDSFHCGHVVAEKNGGELNLDNLRPICGSCNSAMGSTNMEEYIKQLKLNKYNDNKLTKKTNE